MIEERNYEVYSRFEVVLLSVAVCGVGLEVCGVENICVKHTKIKRFMASSW